MAQHQPEFPTSPRCPPSWSLILTVHWVTVGKLPQLLGLSFFIYKMKGLGQIVFIALLSSSIP